jgi:hypothetical protein
MAAPKKKKPRRGAPAMPAMEDMEGDPTMMGGGDPMMVDEGASPPMEMMPPGMEMMAGMGMGAPMMEGGPMMAPSQFPSTDPGMMLAAMSRLMDADHEALSMQQMAALQAVGPMAAQAIARASGMAESVDVPGGPAGMTQ